MTMARMNSPALIADSYPTQGHDNQCRKTHDSHTNHEQTPTASPATCTEPTSDHRADFPLSPGSGERDAGVSGDPSLESCDTYRPFPREAAEAHELPLPTWQPLPLGIPNQHDLPKAALAALSGIAKLSFSSSEVQA